MSDAEHKAKELILYVADQSVDDAHFGATKLQKILAFSDFEAYAVLGSSITGLDYQKLEHGPTLRRYLPLQTALTKAGHALLVPVGKGHYQQHRLVALRPPDLSVFTASEMTIVDAVLSRLRGETAAGVSELSHAWQGWRAADVGEKIPYETAFWGRHALSSDDIERARQLSAAT